MIILGPFELDCVWILMVLIAGSITLCAVVYNGRQGLSKHELWHFGYYFFFCYCMKHVNKKNKEYFYWDTISCEFLKKKKCLINQK